MSVVLDRRPTDDGASVARTVAGVAFGMPMLGVALLTAVVLVSSVALGDDLGDAGGVVAGLWLGSHQVPLLIDGAPLGVLPLLPTLVLGVVTARSVAATGSRGGTGALVVVAAVAGPVVLAVLGVAVIRATSFPLAAPTVVSAATWVALVHTFGALLGLPGTAELMRARLPWWAESGLRAVPATLTLVLTGGAILVTGALVTSWSTAETLFASSDGAWAKLGLLALSVGYLPNVVVGATSVAMGPGAELGQSTVTAFGAVPGPAPAVPVLAALPDGAGAWWWMVVLVVPALTAAWLGRRCARDAGDSGDVTSVLRSVITAAITAGVLLGVIGLAAGGELGGGAFTPVRVPVSGLIVATVAWLLLVGGASGVLALCRSRRMAGGADG